jgi:SAM-dependent methyltransferase
MSKKNSGAAPFHQDVLEGGGYRYTTKAPLSATVANDRLTNLTIAWLLSNCRMGDTVADLGCGDGTYTAELAAALPKLRWLGIDPAKAAITHAKKVSPKISWGVADLLKPASLPRKKAAASILRGVIHHVPQPAKGVATAVRYAPKLLIIEPNGWSPILKIIEEISPYHRAHGERSFTSWTLQSWVEQAGGRVVNAQYVGLVPFFCPDWAVPWLKRLEAWVEASPLAWVCCAQVVLECERD